jgi:hypothetical protein
LWPYAEDVPAGLDVVDACTRAWLHFLRRECLRNESLMFKVRSAGGSFPDVWEASAVQCERSAQEGIQTQLNPDHGTAALGLAPSLSRVTAEDEKNRAPTPIVQATTQESSIDNAPKAPETSPTSKRKPKESISANHAGEITKAVDEWSLTGLSADDRKRIRARILKADAEYWKSSPDDDTADVRALRLAFDGIATVLLDAGILTPELVENGVPELAWSSGTAGNWGPYVRGPWRDWGQRHPGFFRTNISEWLGMLLERSVDPVPTTPPPPMAGEPGREERRAIEKARWAVCLSPGKDAKLPQWFRLQDEARAWQDGMVIPALTVGDVERLPPDRDARLPRGYQQQITRRKQGWRDLVPINWIDERTGHPYAGRRFREFLPLDRVRSVQATDLDADIEEISESRYPNVAYDLGSDWQFDRLQAGANKREGHTFRGRVIDSLPHQLVMIAYDLETSLLNVHPDLPSQALGAFWTSWRVWQHLASWCPKILGKLLQQNHKAVLLQGTGESMAVRFVCRQLSAYAQEVRGWSGASDPALSEFGNRGPKKRKRGPKSDDTSHMRVAEILADYPQWEEDLKETCARLANPPDGKVAPNISQAWSKRHDISSYAEAFEAISEKDIQQHIARRLDLGRQLLARNPQ